MSGYASNSLRMMEKSMDFLWAKQSAHLDNISNAETPGYKVKTVTFEERFDTKLRLAAGGARSKKEIGRVIDNSGWTVHEDDEITRMDENGVNTTEQMVELVRTAYQLQYVYQTISSDLSTLRTAING